jgi:regulator of CtrA degradation
MHVIAWLLTERAVAAGELSRAQAGDAERRLGEAPQTDRDLYRRMPRSAAELVRASEELYDRVSRIDAGHFSEEPAGSPARSLLSRLQRSL